MFIQIKDLLPREFNRNGLKKEVEALEVINKFNRAASKFFSGELLNNFTAKVYKDNKLYVEASSSSAAQALFLKQHDILEAVNSFSGKSALKVEKIVIRTIN